MILGLHYPSDVFAGQVLGHALAPKFLARPKFKADLSEAAEEMRRATSTG